MSGSLSSSKSALAAQGSDQLPFASSSSIPSASSSSNTPPSTASPPQRKKRQLSGWKHSAAGSVGGMAGAIVTSPFDVVKTRLQSDLFSPKNTRAGSTGVAEAAKVAKSRGGLWHFVDTVQLIRRIAVEEGWRALYKGLGPSLVGIIPARATNFYFYPTTKVYLANMFPNAPRSQAGQTSEDSPLIHLGAAVVAGVMTGTVTNPIWVVKTRLQLEASQKPSLKSPNPIPPPTPRSPLPGPIAASARALDATATLQPTTTAAIKPSRVMPPALTMTYNIARTEGIRGLYRGLSASYLGVSEGVIQWVLYERFKRLSRPSDLVDDNRSALAKAGSVVGASGAAKAVASLITYPHEVIRTRLRQPAVNGVNRYTGLLQTLRLVIKEEGAASLYGGLTAHMLRVIPNSCVMFLLYEVIAERLGS